MKIKIEIKLPEYIIILNDIFKSNNYKLYLVGGAVRDSYIGNYPKDYDLATDATPDEIETIIDGKYKLIDGGKAKDCGVTIVNINCENVEIATFREDIYDTNTIGESHLPSSVNLTKNIESDIMRRDITINALFYDIENKEIVDLVGGIDDINNCIIRTVGDAKRRFLEDKLRKLRAIRFSGIFNGKIDIDIHTELCNDNSLDGVSPERIRDEFKKMITKSKSTKHVLNLIVFYEYLELIFPGYNIYKDFKECNNWRLQLGELLKLNDNSKIRSLVDLKYENDETRYVFFYKEFLNLSIEYAYTLNRLNSVVKFTPEELRIICKWNGMDPNLVEAFIRFKPTITGDYVMSEFGLKGEDIGNKIQELEIENFKKLL